MNKDIVEYIFKGFISIVLTLSIYIFSGFESSIEKIQESVSKLNINFAVFSERLIIQKENYIQMNERVTKIEKGLVETMTTRFTKNDQKEFLKEFKALKLRTEEVENGVRALNFKLP